MVIEMYIPGPGSHNSPISIVTRLQAGGVSNSKPNQPSVQGVTQALPQDEMGVQELRPKVQNEYSHISTPLAYTDNLLSLHNGDQSYFLYPHYRMITRSLRTHGISSQVSMGGVIL
jgi:hypothetical protein